MKEIVVYSSPTCPDCHALKEYLRAKGIKFTDRDIMDERWRNELEQKYGRLATPTIVIGSRVFVGFRENLKDIEEALK
ncbi:MAG TPA: glutaredoxin family protein [Nitrospirae bacterium]|nr:glutaredoxin family protein [Nitrospirota bacterium]